jgi:[acyl-carrier-protein] S-malonyltransferase
MTAVGLGIAAELRRSGIEPALCAGHSLGEIAAWSATGAVSPETAVDVAATRGQLMEREARQHPGAMLALLGAETQAVEQALLVGRPHGALVLAAHNAPDEWVLSGTRAAVTAVLCRFRSVKLPMEGAWHSPLMAGAMGELRSLLESVPRAAPRARLVANRTGLAVDDPECVPALLAEQLIHPVEWVRTLETLAASAVTHWVTVGPGKLLKSLLDRTLGTRLRVLGTDTRAELDSAIQELGG